MFDLNPDLDVDKLAKLFAADGRVQIRNILTDSSAANVVALLSQKTDWGVAWQGGGAGPKYVSAEDLRRGNGTQLLLEAQNAAHQSIRDSLYAFQFGSYPMLQAYLERWNPGSAHEAIVDGLNGPPFLQFMRAVTGINELVKADAQATLFAPGHFLATHDDSHREQGWRVAYVLNLSPDDWLPDWGGYLNFLDDDGDIVTGWRPRFNALNLFLVPQRHNVSYVPGFAPPARFAITGWLRDR